MVYNASSRYKLELLFSLNKFNEKNLILNWHRRKCHLLDDILSKNIPLKGDTSLDIFKNRQINLSNTKYFC